MGWADEQPRPRALMARVRTAPLPLGVLVLAIVAVAFAVVPLLALVFRVDAATFISNITSPAAVTALCLSLRTAAVATLACVMLGVPLALVLARMRGRAAALVRTVALLPLVLPPVIGGIALLYTFGRRGLLGQHLEAWGIQIAFTTVAVVLAQTFVSLPFLVVSAEGALRAAGERHQQIAATLGASPTRVLFQVTLPTITPALVAGTILAFARALGEFGATLAFAGSLAGVTRTLPLEVYLVRETDAAAAVSLALVLVAVALIVMAITGSTRVRA